MGKDLKKDLKKERLKLMGWAVSGIASKDSLQKIRDEIARIDTKLYCMTMSE